MKSHPCDHATVVGSTIFCTNKQANDLFGTRPSIGVCLHQCDHYSGPALSPETSDKWISKFSINAPLRLDCIHRGSQVGERPCHSCAGNVMLKVFACELYQQTTIARQVDDLACCATCDDYEKDQDNGD